MEGAARGGEVEVRFCGPGELPLLVEAHNRCWLAHFADQLPLTVAGIDRLARELQIHGSSSLVALSAGMPVGFLLCAIREPEALVYRLAVHPEHLRRGHGRAMLAALSSRLARDGPRRIVAEVPEDLGPAGALFAGCGYAAQDVLTDYLLDPAAHAPGGSGPPPDDSFMVAITVDDLMADGMLAEAPPPPWQRAAESLVALRDGIEGLALAASNRIAAYLLYRRLDAGAGTEIVALRAFDEDEGEPAAGCLVDRAVRRSPKPVRFPGVHPGEVPAPWLAAWGFRPQRTLSRYVAPARPA